MGAGFGRIFWAWDGVWIGPLGCVYLGILASIWVGSPGDRAGQWGQWDHDSRGQRPVMLAQGGKRQGAQSPQAPRCRCCSDSARSSASRALLRAASSTSVPRLDSAGGCTQGAQTPRAPTAAPHQSHGVSPAHLVPPPWYCHSRCQAGHGLSPFDIAYSDSHQCHLPAGAGTHTPGCLPKSPCSYFT